MKEKINISIKNHFISLKWLLIYLVVLIIILLYFYVKTDFDGILVFAFFSLFQIVPSIYLHFMYFNIDKNKLVEFNDDEIKLTIKNQVYIYKTEEIDKIIIFKSANMDKYGIPFMVFENYYFTKIMLKSKSNFILTSLLDNRIEEKLKKIKNVKFEREKGFSFFKF